nr:unnamed protein product [Callosobruchus analis]
MRLSIMEFMEYIGGSEHSKCVVEGENVLKVCHLILAGKIQEQSCTEYMTVYGLCLQTSALDSNPHEITGKLELGTSVKISSMLCTCKAGNSGKCKHASAFLIRCVREDVETLAPISQTDKKCVWATQRNLTKEKYRPVPVAEMPCFSGKILKSNITVDSNSVLDYFCRKLPNSAIAMHREGRREEPSTIKLICTQNTNVTCGEEILNHACQSPLMMYLASYKINLVRDCCLKFISTIDNEDVDLAINIPQHSSEWEKIRKNRITGSRCYEIYTYSKEDWKTKSIKYFHPIAVNNKYTRHGLKYESMARNMFIEMSKMTVVECGLVIPCSNKWLGYSPDGIIMCDGRPLYLLEIKYIFEGKTKTITEALKSSKYILEENGEYKLKKKHKYYGQVQMGMAVLNLSKTYFVIFASFDKSFCLLEVNFDYDYTHNMLKVVKQSYFQKMIHHCCN